VFVISGKEEIKFGCTARLASASSCPSAVQSSQYRSFPAVAVILEKDEELFLPRAALLWQGGGHASALL
jgi:hypothetical protein